MAEIEEKAKKPETAKRPTRKESGANRTLNRPKRRAIAFSGPLAPYAKYVSPGFIGRWVADRPDKIERRRMMGFRTVNKPNEDGSGEAPIIVFSGGSGEKLVLMELPESIAAEYREYAEELVDEATQQVHEKAEYGPQGIPFYDGKLHKD